MASNDVASKQQWIQLFHDRFADRQLAWQSESFTGASQRLWRKINLVYRLHITGAAVCRQLLRAGDVDDNNVESGPASDCSRRRIEARIPRLPSRVAGQCSHRRPTGDTASTSNEMVQRWCRQRSLEDTDTRRHIIRRSSYQRHHLNHTVINRTSTQ